MSMKERFLKAVEKKGMAAIQPVLDQVECINGEVALGKQFNCPTINIGEKIDFHLLTEAHALCCEYLSQQSHPAAKAAQEAHRKWLEHQNYIKLIYCTFDCD